MVSNTAASQLNYLTHTMQLAKWCKVMAGHGMVVPESMSVSINVYGDTPSFRVANLKHGALVAV
jgi:hypothetical protein